MGKKKGKPKSSSVGEEGEIVKEDIDLSEEAKANLIGLAQGVDQGGGEKELESGEKAKEGEIKEEPKKRKGRKKKTEVSPMMIEAIKPLISYPVNTLLVITYGKDVFPLSEEEKDQLAQATDALFNKWFPVLIDKWQEEFAFGLVLLSIFSKRLMIREEMKRVRRLESEAIEKNKEELKKKNKAGEKVKK